MSTDLFPNEREAHLARLQHALCTRTLNHFAEEAKLNGESLRDAFERYDIDYAWHVLGSDRLRDATLACMVQQHGHVATELQQASLVSLLKSAAEAQASELLMSFDNEVPEQLAASLVVDWAGRGPSAGAAQAV